MNLQDFKGKIQEIIRGDKRKRLIIIAIIGAVLIFLSLRLFLAPKKAKAPVLKPVVQTMVLTLRPLHKNISLFGKTTANGKIEIVNKYPGKISRINVELGDRVKQGDILLIQELDDIRLEVGKAEAEYLESEALAAKAATEYTADSYKYKSDYQLQQLNFQRYKKLYEAGAISKVEFDRAEQTMINARAAYEALAAQENYGGIPAVLYAKEQNARQKEQTLRLLQNKEQDMILTAPRGGIISYRNAEVGNYALAGSKLLTLIDNGGIYVDCSVSEHDAAALKPGQKIKMEIESMGESFPGEIIFVSPDQGESSRSFPVRIKLEGTGEKVKSGMFARGEVRFLLKESALYVNKDALMEKEGKKYLFILGTDNKVEQRQVKTGLTNAQEVEIIQGAAPGEKIAASNLARLRKGLLVQPQEQKDGRT